MELCQPFGPILSSSCVLVQWMQVKIGRENFSWEISWELSYGKNAAIHFLCFLKSSHIALVSNECHCSKRGLVEWIHHHLDCLDYFLLLGTQRIGRILIMILLWFLTADEPSRCYFHDGDGVCEEFEQMTSIKDCGVYTPKGFLDQWASNVSVSHNNDQQCPGWVVIGQPAATQVRKSITLFSANHEKLAVDL